MSRAITVKISKESLSEAIKDLKNYEKSVVSKTDKLRRRVADELAFRIRNKFATSIVDDLIGESPRFAQVHVSVENSGNISAVVASGQDAIWVEFGAGVYHNTSVGTSPHPRGRSYGFLIGTYGKHRGKQNVWGFFDEGNNVHITHGTPATMPMYLTGLEIVREINSMAREVFA